MEKSIIDKIDSYIDARKKLITCYTETLYHTLKFSKLLNDKNFIAGLESGLKKLLLGYLCDIRFYYRFLNDIKIKYPEFDIKKIQKNIYLSFFDYNRAFDCVDHNKLWKILQEMGIPDHLTCLLGNLCRSRSNR